MPIPLDAPEVLSREFLEIRAKLLQLAATLDRLERAAGDVHGDGRMTKIREALAILSRTDCRGDDGVPNRAERLQLLFSLPYHDDWKKRFEIDRH